MHSLNNTRSGWRDRLRPAPATRLFAAYVCFTCVFSVLVPWLICSKYDIPRTAQDFYRMPKPGGDYIATHVAAESLRKGRPIYKNFPGNIDPFASGSLSRYTYAPPQAYLFVPLSFLSYEHSYTAWTWLTCVFVGLSMLFASRLFERPWTVFVAGCMVYAQSTFILFQMERGQTDVLPLLCMVLCLYFHIKRRNPYLAGLFCALGMAIKVIPGILLLYFLLRRDIKAILSTGVSAVLLVLATGLRDWITWFTTIVPAWSGTFIGQNVDHSLVYLYEAFTRDVQSARLYGQITSGLLLCLYAALVLLNKDRGKLVLIELAILSLIMEIITPWSVNYKLVMLIFLFVSPFALLQTDGARRRPITYSLPLFVSFLLMVPIFGEYLTRLPFSLAARLLPGQVIISNPVDPFITDRKVILGILIALGYLLCLYLLAAIRSRPRLAAAIADRLPQSIRGVTPARLAVLGGATCLILAGSAFAYMALASEGEYERAISRFGEEHPINESVSVAGYILTPGGANRYTFEIIYHSNDPMPHNAQIYLHAHEIGENGERVRTAGRNFFPSLITSYWPADRFVVAKTTCGLEPAVYDVRVGFFDLSNGQRYGETNVGLVEVPPAAGQGRGPRS